MFPPGARPILGLSPRDWLGAFALIGGLLILSIIPGSRSRETPMTSGTSGVSILPATESAEHAYTRRLVLEDRSEDGAVRDVVFADLLSKRGRCDYVSRALMVRPGVWRISCAPGYVYRLAIGQDLRVYDVGWE